MTSIRQTVALAAAGVLTLGSAAAQAQLPAGLSGRSSRPAVRADRRPTLSPYLFLADPNTSNLTGRYFLQVRPRVEIRRNEALLGQSLRNVQQEVREVGDRQRQLIQDPTSLLTPSGVGAGFMTHTKYFGGSRR